MILATELYDDCVQRLAPEENGNFSYALFNSFSWQAQLRMMDWLTGDIEGRQPPEPYLTQKNKDWLSPFIVEDKVEVVNGVWPRPADYYQIENLWPLGTSNQQDCETGKAFTVTKGTKPIEIVDGSEVVMRSQSYIKGLRPDENTIIAKMNSKGFVFAPSDAGSIGVEYYRYPVRAKIIPKPDPLYNNEIPDTVVNFEWDEKAREVLLWFISDLFANRNREQANKQFNAATGKTVRA